MNIENCPKCQSEKKVKSGKIQDKQRFKCKSCGYFYTVDKLGKSIDPYYIIKAMQLYLEGISFREIERVIGVSHVSIINWVKKYNIKPIFPSEYSPTYQVYSKKEFSELILDSNYLKNSSMIVNELGDKLMVIKWERK